MDTIGIEPNTYPFYFFWGFWDFLFFRGFCNIRMVSIYVQMSSVVAVSLLVRLLTGEEHGEQTRSISPESAEHVRMLCPVSPHTLHFLIIFFLDFISVTFRPHFLEL